ncbi:MAG: glutamate-5-semialdehyde dehydrogenase [Lachnospiraceae bacterium]|nr:glutamate-5-semialdehyde dehydrogenase [Lachnospiraceae bacterium]
MTIKEKTAIMKEVSPVLAATDIETRNAALSAVAQALKKNCEAIFAANRVDLDNAASKGLAAPVIKRLAFNESKLAGVLEGIQGLIGLPDPLGRILLDRELDEGLELQRIACPIGVIGVIFEARPDALVQISTLCLKSGNCAILKGGSETANTNRELFNTIYHATISAGLPKGCLVQAEERSEISELLECDEYVDLLIPRGSNAFVRYIMDNTRITVMGHADGVCHVYVDKDADQEMALKVIIDAKTQYVSVCNAAETILVDRRIADNFLPKLANALKSAHVECHGDGEVRRAFEDLNIDTSDFCLMDPQDYHTEYLDYKLSIKLVNDAAEAVRHINRFGSHHTDSIITANEETARTFFSLVDSANVYHNCSTRFADGFRYGFGAEVGISTSKLHARGPVGLEGLVTYKYLLHGNGHIVADYAEGRKAFHFKDIL